MTSTAGVHLVQGRRVTMPVRIRKATVAAAVFPVPAGSAQAVIAHSGLTVAEPLPGRAICSLAFVRYIDGDLGSYREFAVVFLVRETQAAWSPWGALARVRGLKGVGVFVHWLAVDQSFTLEAGRAIWGFPKEPADIPTHRAGRVRRAVVRVEGRTAVELAVRPGLAVPGVAPARTIGAFSRLDGTTRRTPWTMASSGIRLRPGGATVGLGDHPVAEQLRRLGLDGARALVGGTAAHVRMSFDDAVVIT